jgi:Pvc16 N-terminal domain
LIDAIDLQLQEWVNSVVDGVAVSFLAPGREKAQPCISLYLMELREKRSPSTQARAPLQILLRYLVTTTAANPSEAHRLLGNLIFAAMEKPGFQATLDSLDAAVWTAFGVPPQPAFQLEVPLVKEREQPIARRVREPVVVTVSLSNFEGVVVGPGKTPIAGARVEIPALRRVTTSDHNGVFQFSSLPAGRTVGLLIHARGQSLAVTADGAQGAQQNRFIVDFPISEG